MKNALFQSKSLYDCDTILYDDRKKRNNIFEIFIVNTHTHTYIYILFVPMDQYLVAVHVGAGFHGRKKEPAYKRLMEEACIAAGNALEDGKGISMAISAAICVLEDSCMTNAGNGSNLNVLGNVETDALVITDGGLVGAVAAAPGLVNPIRVATELALQSDKVLPLGRVPPVMLAGHGARLWASEQGLQPLQNEIEAVKMHITEQSRSQFEKYSSMVSHREKKLRRRDSCELNDTVGCVIVDQHGNSAAGVSSGGIPLKYPGRVGEASIPGAGGWSCRVNSLDQVISMGCSVSGVGERIQKNLVARHISDSCINGAPDNQGSLSSHILTELGHLLDQEMRPKDCGILLTRTTNARGTIEVELAASFMDSSSFGLGYRARVERDRTYQDYLILREDKNRCGNLDVGVHWKLER